MPGNCCHEQLGAVLVGRGGPAGIEHDLLLGLGLLVEFVERFAACGGRDQHGERGAGWSEPGYRFFCHKRFPRIVLLQRRQG